MRSYLDEFVEDYGDLELDVGLRGEITLSNVTLKQQKQYASVSWSSSVHRVWIRRRDTVIGSLDRDRHFECTLGKEPRKQDFNCCAC